MARRELTSPAYQSWASPADWFHAVHHLLTTTSLNAQEHSHRHLHKTLNDKTIKMIAKAHMRGLWEAGGCFVISFFTRYVSLSFHPFFHSPGISICIGACHACTASQCDLRDPGWEDPGFRHCDFFALAPFGPSGDVLGFVLVCFQRMACSVLGTQVALLHHFSLQRFMMSPLHWFLLCGWLLLFLFCLLFVAGVVFVSLWVLVGLLLCISGTTSYGSALQAQEAYYSIGFTCSN